jgi:hypothetical protein
MEIVMKKFSFFKKHILWGLTFLSLFFLLMTGFDRHQRHPLTSASSQVLPHFALDKNQLLVTARMMTVEESKRNFGHDLISREVQPLQLTIQNNTSDEYSLCPSSVDLPRVDAGKIAFKITKSAIPRSIAYKIAGFFFWPFMIPGTIDSIRVLSHHQKVKKDLQAKSMRDEVVAPYSTFNRVLFVPEKEFQETFKVTLIELESLQPQEFEVTAESSGSTS